MLDSCLDSIIASGLGQVYIYGMLKLAKLTQPGDKKSFFSDFNPDQDVWVVSDLRTKLELQKEIMQGRPGIPGDAILRGSELWTQLLKIYRPRFQVVSRDWIQLFARTAMGQSLSPSDLKICVDLLAILGPVFSHPRREEVLQDMMERDPSAVTRWGKVLTETQFLFDQARGLGWILQENLAASLTEIDDLRLRHPVIGEGRLYFDLGASLTASEAEVIRRLAIHHEVIILLPRPEFAANFKFLLQPGESFLGESLPLAKAAPSIEKGQKKRQYSRFSGRAAEIKNAIGQVRQWLDAGVAIENIVVITPNFEMDFPVLALGFQVEGVPLDRELSERVQTHRLLQKWSSKLRLWKEDLEYADLVTAFQDGLPLRSEKFAARLKTGLFHVDLERATGVRDQAEPWKWNPQETPLAGFFKQATALWMDADFSDLERIFESLNEQTPAGVSLSTRDWIEWMEVQTARLETTRSRGGNDRLAVVPLQSADSLQWTHRIYLSMVDALPEKGATALLNRDEIDRLGWTHGFFLSHPEQKVLQFELEWSLLSPGVEEVLSYPLTDWTGAPTSPQALWLSGRQNTGHEADVPETTRWDELQKNRASEAGLGALASVEKVMELVPQMQNLNLSASSVQNYGNCPFIFAAEKVLGLVDPPLVDLDLDRRSLGQLQHAFLEYLTTPPIQWERRREELEKILDELAVKSDEVPKDPALWRAQRTKWVGFGQRFLKAEQSWFQQFPQTRILAREHKFKFVFDPETKNWRSGDRQHESEVLFRGSLDRVDALMEGSQIKAILLYDYKASVQSWHSFSNWQTQNEIQLGFYSWAIQQGLIEPDWKGKVTGAIYYNLRTLNRESGFLLPDFAGQMYPAAKPKKINAEELHQFWEALRMDVEARVLNVRAGRFAPEPRDRDDCAFCHWRGLCRAPHLI